MKSIKKYIPNTITSLNLFCGVSGVLCCVHGNVAAAFYFMLAAAVFDFCDGLAARLLGAYSDMGRELDSISDVVSFGVLPAVMLSCMAFDSFNFNEAHKMALPELVSLPRGTAFWLYVVACSPVLMAVFSGLRLAKFNVDTRQSDKFLGLATPAAAILVGAFVCLLYNCSGNAFVDALWSWNAVRIYVPIAVVAISALLVCELPMFAFKIKKGCHLFSGPEGVQRIVFFVSVALSAAVALVFRLHFSVVFVLSMLMYVLINIFAGLCTCLARLKK